MKKKIVIIISVILLVICGSVFGYLYIRNNKIVTTITMDINPNIILYLNNSDRIIKVESVNEDGNELIKDNEYRGKTLKNTINEISTILLEKGYIKEEDNVILVNVDGQGIKDEVSTLIIDSLKDKNVVIQVITQEINKEAKDNASKYHVSNSKASYIEEIIDQNSNYTFEELKDKSMTELRDLNSNDSISTKEESSSIKDGKSSSVKKETSSSTKKETSSSVKKETSSSAKKETTSKKKTTSDGRKGSISQCENITEVITRDDAIAKTIELYGVDPFYIQTIAQLYNGYCVYESKFVQDKKLYTVDYNIETGLLVRNDYEQCLVCDYSSIIETVTQYFVTTYGATIDQIQVIGAGGTVNDKNRDAMVRYNGVDYDVVIVGKTGEIVSVKPRN